MVRSGPSGPSRAERCPRAFSRIRTARRSRRRRGLSGGNDGARKPWLVDYDFFALPGEIFEPPSFPGAPLAPPSLLLGLAPGATLAPPSLLLGLAPGATLAPPSFGGAPLSFRWRRRACATVGEWMTSFQRFRSSAHSCRVRIVVGAPPGKTRSTSAEAVDRVGRVGGVATAPRIAREATPPDQRRCRLCEATPPTPRGDADSARRRRRRSEATPPTQQGDATDAARRRHRRSAATPPTPRGDATDAARRGRRRGSSARRRRRSEATPPDQRGDPADAARRRGDPADADLPRGTAAADRPRVAAAPRPGRTKERTRRPRGHRALARRLAVAGHEGGLGVLAPLELHEPEAAAPSRRARGRQRHVRDGAERREPRADRVVVVQVRVQRLEVPAAATRLGETKDPAARPVV